MDFNGKNPYEDPGACGMKYVASLDIAGSYEFDMCCVWQDIESGDLYYGFDSGCSCPTPFENVTGLVDLNRLEVAEFERVVRDWVHNGWNSASPADYQDFVRVVIQFYFANHKAEK